MWKKVLAISLMLITVLALVACAEETKEEIELPSAQEMVDKIITASDNIRTYQFDMDVITDMTYEDEDEVSITNVTQNLSGILDVENREIGLVWHVNIKNNGQLEGELVNEVYLTNGTKYITGGLQRGELTWIKDEVIVEEWWEESRLTAWSESQLELLDGTHVEVIGSEVVDGVDCYVLEVTPDLIQLYQLTVPLVFLEIGDVTEEYLQEVIRSFSVKQWFAKDTFFLTRAEIDIATEFPLDEPGLSSSDIAIVLSSHNYNQSVSIELPPEAEEAIVMPTPTLGPTPPPALVLLPPPVPPETAITFPDKNLAAAIRDMLGIPMGDNITAAELATLMMLEAPKYGISDLTGIEYCVNLGNLNLNGNQISDISPLSNLTNLAWLHLSENQIRDISTLENLTNLTGFSLGDNQISDISPLSSLTNLTNIYIWGNQISDITPLSSLTNLNQLNLYGNKINDIISLANLTSLTWLNLDDNQISDISPLSSLTNLNQLSLYGNQISDVTPLANLTSLTWLRLHENQLSDIAPLQNLTSLTDLWLHENQITDISPLRNLVRLYMLSAEMNEISNLNPLANLTNLTELWLWDNQISDLTPLTNLTSLTELGLWGNQISDITPLSNLTSLTWLSLEHNEISDITPLSNLTSLTELYLQDNQISDISPLSNLTSLTELHLQDNQISDISPLSKLTSLTWLRLHENQISDISLLVENSGLGAGDEVSLEDNELDLTEGSEDMDNIETLEDRGVVIHYE